MHYSRIIVVAIAIILLASGCRTYGGYGSEEALYRQIHRANQELADEFERLQAQRPLLERAAEASPAPVPLQDVIAGYEGMLERHRRLAESLSESSGHRELSRAYGAIISDQELIRFQMRQIQARLASEAEDQVREVRLPYTIIPVHYDRVGAVTPRQRPQPEMREDAAPTEREQEQVTTEADTVVTASDASNDD